MRQQPEERVRQQVVADLVERYQFPRAMIALECKLNQLPCVTKSKLLVNRRCDIVCFAKGEQDLFPILLIECKSGPLKISAFEQMISYNHYVGAHFGALVNETEVLFCPLQKTKSMGLEHSFCSYPDLMQRVKKEKIWIK